MRKGLLLFLVFTLLVSCENQQEDKPLTIFVAASYFKILQSMKVTYPEISNWRLVPESSGQLARQIKLGSPADVFISANQKWIDWLYREDLRSATWERFPIGRNKLVFVVDKHFSELCPSEYDPIKRITCFVRHSEIKRITSGDPQTAPLGQYALQSMQAIQLSDIFEMKLHAASNASAAAVLIQQSLIEAGILYASDAVNLEPGKLVIPIPDQLHDPIEYFAVALNQKANTREAFEIIKNISHHNPIDPK